eukprot:Rhum_TRINITY_DN14717_c7_g3::Rhum_TRINITY_DN14717_c7_g3_i1::g.113894::m.113894
MKASTVRSLCYAAFAAGTYPSSYFLNLLHLVRRRCAVPGHSSAELDACVETLLQYDESGEVAEYLADERVSAASSASTPHAKIHMRVLPPGTPMRAQVAGWPMISHADLKDTKIRVVLQCPESWCSDLCIKAGPKGTRFGQRMAVSAA